MNRTMLNKALISALLLALRVNAFADAPTESGDFVAPHKPKVAISVAAAEPKKRDPLKVDPHTAVKDSATKEINLPGVLKIEGANANALDFTRARVVQLTNGGSVSVYLSATEPNRIQLPFVDPYIIGTKDLAIQKRAESNNVYIQFKESAPQARQIYIESPEGDGAVLGLQLVPKTIPAQTIIVEDVSKQAAGIRSKGQQSNEYISNIQALMETVAQGATPNGYSIVELSVPPIAMGSLLVEVDKKLSNREADIFVYAVTNPTNKPTTITEPDFDGELVQAISITPKPTILPKETVRVIVVARREREVQ